jgi:hypothetical protein
MLPNIRSPGARNSIIARFRSRSWRNRNQNSVTADVAVARQRREPDLPADRANALV